MLQNQLGRLIVNSLPGNVDIFPFLSGDANANSAIKFAPQNFAGNMAPGGRPNEILFHELCHIADGTLGTYVNLVDPASGVSFQYDQFDFFSVNATNVYASMRGRPLRKDHWGFQVMPGDFRDSDTFFELATPNLNRLKASKPNLYGHVSAIDAPWNPF